MTKFVNAAAFYSTSVSNSIGINVYDYSTSLYSDAWKYNLKINADSKCSSLLSMLMSPFNITVGTREIILDVT